MKRTKTIKYQLTYKINRFTAKRNYKIINSMVTSSLNHKIISGLAVFVSCYVVWCLFSRYTEASLQKVKYEVVGNVTRDNQIVKTIGHSNKFVEIRKYDEFVAVEAIYRGVKLRVAMDLGLQDIGAYFLGKNSQSLKIEMALPIMIERIPNQNAFLVSIPVNSQYTLQSLPTPIDRRLRIRKVPTRIIASKPWYGAVPSSTLMDIKKAKIQNILQNSRYKIKGNVMLLEYDSPLSPSWMRKNEVAFEVAQKEIEKVQ